MGTRNPTPGLVLHEHALLRHAQEPHESELYDVRVDEEEVRSSSSLRSVGGVRGAVVAVWVCVGEEDVAE